MRNTFASELTSIASTDDRIVLLSGDIGNRLFDEFKKHFPKRFYNCGVAEANMMSMAAGMAMSGMRPITYTITPFTTIRCLEQIKIDVCYHNLPVIIVGIGSGLSYAELGATHHSCDDIAFLRVLPNMTVICPCDSYEAKMALRKSIEYNKPVYIRLGKKGEPIIHKDESDFHIGKGITITQGADVCILSTGTIMPVVLQAGEELKKKNISAEIISYHTVKPLDIDMLNRVFSKFKVVVAVEEHSVVGGLGSSIAEWFVKQENLKARLLSIGISDEFFYDARNQDYARKCYGLTPEGITEKIMDYYRKDSE